MGSWGGAAKGAVGGAAAGAVLGPWGAAAGGLIGGLYGGLSGGSGSNIGAIGEAQYGGGNSPEAQFAHQEADRVHVAGDQRQLNADTLGRNEQSTGYAAGNTALLRGQVLGSDAQAQGARLGNTAQSQAWNGQQDAAYNQGRSQNLQNVGMMGAGQAGTFANQDRSTQQSALGRLQQFYQQGPGPSAAEAQMRQGADQNMAQQLALAHSGRGVGGNAAAMRQAQFQNAATGTQMNQQLGVLRANEAANWRQQQMGAMGLEQNAMAGMRGQDIGQQGQNQNFALGAGQQGLGYGQLGQGYQQIGNQAQLGFSQQGLQGQLGFEGMGSQANLGYFNGSNSARLGEQGLGQNAYQFGEGMRNNILQSQGNFNLQQQTNNLNSQVGVASVNQRQDAANQAFLGSTMSGIGAMANSGGGGGTPAGGGGGGGYAAQSGSGNGTEGGGSGNYSNPYGLVNPWA